MTHEERVEHRKNGDTFFEVRRKHLVATAAFILLSGTGIFWLGVGALIDGRIAIHPGTDLVRLRLRRLEDEDRDARKDRDLLLNLPARVVEVESNYKIVIHELKGIRQDLRGRLTVSGSAGS